MKLYDDLFEFCYGQPDYKKCNNQPELKILSMYLA